MQANTNAWGIPHENADAYEKSAGDLQRWIELAWSRKHLHKFRLWAEHASLTELEDWWSRTQTHDVLRTLKPHHTQSIRDEWIELVTYYRGPE